MCWGFLLLTEQPFAAKAQEPKRFQYKIVEVLRHPEYANHVERVWSERVGVGGGVDGSMTEPRLIFKK